MVSNTEILEHAQNLLEDSQKVKKQALIDNFVAVLKAVDVIVECITNNRKVLLFGNGGSAADAQHIAAEFVGRFQHERRPLPAHALTTNTSILTAIGNDYSFDVVFSRQIQAMSQPGDIVWGLSTSGNSFNCVEAFKVAKELGLKIISFTGNEGGEMAQYADINIIVPSKSTPRIQECQIFLYHLVCELVEEHIVERDSQ